MFIKLRIFVSSSEESQVISLIKSNTFIHAHIKTKIEKMREMII